MQNMCNLSKIKISWYLVSYSRKGHIYTQGIAI